MNLTELLLTIPAITATVQWLKALGLSPRIAMFASVLVGVLFAYLSFFATYNGMYDLIVPSMLINTGAQGFLYGLAAAGFYDLAHGNLKPKNDSFDSLDFDSAPSLTQDITPYNYISPSEDKTGKGKHAHP